MLYDRLLASVERTRDLEPQALRAWVRRALGEMATQDWLVVAYFWCLTIAVMLAAESPERTQNLLRLIAIQVVLAVGILSVRGGLIVRPLVAAVIYRVTMLGTVTCSYLMLRSLLPVANPGTLDGQLYQLDLRVFGVEPSLWMDQFVGPRSTEWFAFFYYSYFFLLATYLLPMLFICRRMKLFAEFSLGFLATYCIAQVLYILVPGYGPCRYLAAEFHNQLPLGFWFERVMTLVNSAGAQKDIFPSLHTGGPAFCLFFSLRHRRELPFKYIWPVTMFFAVNIIIATMFLRWHYLIDIVAGLSLSLTTHLVSHSVAQRETRMRERKGLQPIWLSLLPERTEEAPLAQSEPSA